MFCCLLLVLHAIFENVQMILLCLACHNNDFRPQGLMDLRSFPFSLKQDWRSFKSKGGFRKWQYYVKATKSFGGLMAV